MSEGVIEFTEAVCDECQTVKPSVFAGADCHRADCSGGQYQRVRFTGKLDGDTDE